MGCFNKIGFISSLPITMSDETVLVFMEPNKYERGRNSGVCYSTDWYSPVFLPVFGEYDDYGRIENVKRTKSVEFIENFFGLDIDTIINEVDDNSVGRGGKKLSATKNEEIYDKLTFGLELKRVFDKLSSFKVNAYTEDWVTDWWLMKMGFTKIENNSDKRYNKTWTHPSSTNYQYHSDGMSGHLFNLTTNQVHVGFTFHPSYLEVELDKVTNGTYKSILTDEDKNLCSIDLSLINTKLAIEEYESSKTGDALKDMKNEMLYGVPRYNGYENITSWIDKCRIDGTPYSHDSRRQPIELIKQVDSKEITDFVRFNQTISNLNAKYQPSNYGSQEQDYKLHLEMLRCYRECIKDKLSKYDYDGDHDILISEMVSDERDDKLTDVLS